MPPQDPNDPDTTDDDQTDVWEDVGSRAPARPLTDDEVMALGAQGLGGEAVRQRYLDRQFYINQGIGNNEPPLDAEAKAAAVATSLQIQQERLDGRREIAEAMPEGSERTEALAKIRVEQENLDKKKNQHRA